MSVSEQITVGIDVSKDRLDVHIRPSAEIFVVARDGAGLPVVVVNPAQVRSFARALGKRAKTDPIDAAVIAHFAEATAPEIRPMPDAATRLLFRAPGTAPARTGEHLEPPDPRRLIAGHVHML